MSVSFQEYKDYIKPISKQHPNYFKFRKEILDLELKSNIFSDLTVSGIYIFLALTCSYFFNISGFLFFLGIGTPIYLFIILAVFNIKYSYSDQKRSRMFYLCKDEKVCFHALSDYPMSRLSLQECEQWMRYEQQHKEKEQVEYDAVMTSIPYTEIQRSLEHVLQEYAQVESDPRTIISIPLILDVTVPQTSVFHQMLQETQGIQDDILSAEKYEKATREHVQVIDDLVQSWEEALDYAREIGMNGITEREKEKAAKLLNRVLHPANEYELDLDRAALIRILENVEYKNSETYRNDNLNVQKIVDEHVLMIEAKERMSISE